VLDSGAESGAGGSGGGVEGRVRKEDGKAERRNGGQVRTTLGGRVYCEQRSLISN
jgi:hypothetical protein